MIYEKESNQMIFVENGKIKAIGDDAITKEIFEKILRGIK